MKYIIYKEKKIKRPTPVNFNPNDDHLFKKYWNTIWPQCHLHKLKNPYIIKESVFLPNKFKFFDHYTHYNQVSVLGKIERLIYFILRKKSNLDKVVWIHDNFSANYYHWFTECVPRLLFAEKYLDGHVVLLPERFKRLAFIPDSLDILGVKYVYFQKNQMFKISELILTSLIGRISEYQRDLLFQVKGKFNSLEFKSLPERKIYIQRRPAKARNIINEGEVLKVLMEFNVEIHFFEDYTLKQQIEIMNNTHLLISIHGAGLTNMLFMPIGGNVLEFRNAVDGGDLTNCYFNLASELGMKYYYTTNKSTLAKTNHSNFEIDTSKLRSTLNLILEEN